MPRTIKSKKSLIQKIASERGWSVVAEPEWRILRDAVPGLKPDDLQRAFSDGPVRITTPWGGVRQHSFDDLEQSLRDLAEVYEAREDLRRFCRTTVIRAKDRAKFAARSPRVPTEKRAVKAEMAEWMLVWLGDPALFAEWARLRRLRL